MVDAYPTTPDLAAFGGLTDPTRHAPDVLPILVRDASGVGGDASTVTVDGVPYVIPPFTPPGLSAPIGVMAFTTTGFEVAVLPSGESTLTLDEAPLLGVVGGRWVYRWASGQSVYEIVGRDGDRLQIRKTGDTTERIAARLLRGRVHVEEVVVESASESPGEVALTFAEPYLADPLTADFGRRPPGCFSVSVAGKALVTGTVESDAHTVVLRSADPPWAATRVVAVSATRDGSRLRSTVGASG